MTARVRNWLLARGKQAIHRFLARRGYRLSRLESGTHLVSDQIPGWISTDEAETLYLLAATTLGTRILEIGHFLGCSTSALCEGIRDSGAVIDFASYDLGFRNTDDFVAHYVGLYNGQTFSIPPEYEELVFRRQLTTTDVARENLARFGLDRYVRLISGDFAALDRTRYGLIFCDALHNPCEIARNLPGLIAVSEDTCVWALHDMNDENVAAVLRSAPTRLIRTVGALGIFAFRRSVARAATG